VSNFVILFLPSSQNKIIGNIVLAFVVLSVRTVNQSTWQYIACESSQ